MAQLPLVDRSSRDVIVPSDTVCSGSNTRIDAYVRRAELASARQTASHLPSRLDCIFAFLTLDEARLFASRNARDWAFHHVYRVRLVDPSALSQITDWRLNVPLGTFRPDWADACWLPWDSQTVSLPGVNSIGSDAIGQMREILTLSQPRVEEHLN
jgi:hypothetical protein